MPALLEAVEKETNNDIVTGCLIALAKIGDAASETGDSAMQTVIAKFLSDNNQEISETSAVALGILANTKSIPALHALLKDTSEGRKLVGKSEVNYRTRAFERGNKGLRIDYLLLSPPAMAACTGVEVDLDARRGPKPSDHAPVIAELA